MSNGHGGARAGAGRKPHKDKYAAQREALHDRIADRLGDRVAAMELLAEGGYEQVEETYEPAGLIYVGSGESRSLAFPHLPPEQLVCVRRTRSFAAPDRKANEYLIDRIAGRPTARLDLDTDPDGTLELTATAMSEAAKELAEWRRTQTAMLSSLPSVPPMPPTPATPTE